MSSYVLFSVSGFLFPFYPSQKKTQPQNNILCQYLNLNQQCLVLQTTNCKGKKKKKEKISLTSEKKFYLHFTDIYIDMFLFARMFWETESFKYSYIFLVLELVTQLTTTWKRLESIRGRNKSIPQD